MHKTYTPLAHKRRKAKITSNPPIILTPTPAPAASGADGTPNGIAAAPERVNAADRRHGAARPATTQRGTATPSPTSAAGVGAGGEQGGTGGDGGGPLGKRIERWYTELIDAHRFVCKSYTKHSPCRGLRPLKDIIATQPLSHDQEPKHLASANEPPDCCLQATECELLLNGLYYGFAVLPPGATIASVPPIHVENYPCDGAVGAAIAATISDELAAGIIRELSDRPRHVSALHGKVEKDKIRPLRDYKAPLGASVNSNSHTRRFTMMSMDDALACMTPFCYMSKVDIKAAFRTVGVRQQDQEFLAFAWPDDRGGRMRYYADNRLPFGWTGSPEIFCRITQAVRLMMASRGYNLTIVYVDDFLIIAQTEAECKIALDILLQLLDDLGFTVSPTKTVEPCQRIIFLGLLLESNLEGIGKMQITVPEEKLLKAEQAVQDLLSDISRVALRRSAAVPRPVPSVISLKTLQSVLGYLNHIAKAVYSSRAYMRGMIDACKSAKAENKWMIEVNPMMIADLNWWYTFARVFNGRAQILSEPVMCPGYLATDASTSWGMGGFLSSATASTGRTARCPISGRLRGHYFSINWNEPYYNMRHALPPHVRKYFVEKLLPRADMPRRFWIDYREQFAIFYAMLLWVDDLQGTHVAFQQDNQVATTTLNNLCASNWQMQRLIHAMAAFMADHNMRAQCYWIPSKQNLLADPLSRGDMPTFWEKLTTWVEPVAPKWAPRSFRDPPLLEQAAAEFRGFPSPQTADEGEEASGLDQECES